MDEDRELGKNPDIEVDPADVRKVRNSSVFTDKFTVSPGPSGRLTRASTVFINLSLSTSLSASTALSLDATPSVIPAQSLDTAPAP